MPRMIRYGRRLSEKIPILPGVSSARYLIPLLMSPFSYVPALAVGFDDLQKRVEAQKAQATAHTEKIKELKTRITTLANSHSTTNTPRLQRAAAVQTQLQQRLVRLVQHLHLLIPSVRSSSIRPEEDTLRSMLESLDEEIRRPGGVGRLKGKLNELWAMIGAIETAREREQTKNDNNVEWAVVDPEGLQRLTKVYFTVLCLSPIISYK